MESQDIWGELGRYSLVLRERLRRYASHAYPVDDLVQDTFLEAYGTIRNRGPPQQPLAWLVTIGKRTAARNRTRYRPMAAYDECFDAQNGHDIDSPLELLVREEEEAKDWRAVQALDPEQQALLRDHYVVGKSYPAIAREHDTTEAAVKAKALRARKRARQIRSLLG